jgi:hypothetical protein
LDNIEALSGWEHTLLDVAVNARNPDCAIAFERATKGFLLSGERRFIDYARRLLKILMGVEEGTAIDDLNRLRKDLNAFIIQAEASLPA